MRKFSENCLLKLKDCVFEAITCSEVLAIFMSNASLSTLAYIACLLCFFFECFLAIYLLLCSTHIYFEVYVILIDTYGRHICKRLCPST